MSQILFYLNEKKTRYISLHENEHFCLHVSTIIMILLYVKKKIPYHTCMLEIDHV